MGTPTSAIRRKKRLSNKLVVSSIPIRRALKSYVIRRFEHLARCNGCSFAADDMKAAREALMRYRADPERIENLQKHLETFPWKRSGWVLALFQYMDCQPQAVLALLKCYTSFPEPLVTVEAAEEDSHQRLLDIPQKVSVDTPRFLLYWLDWVMKGFSKRELYEWYSQFRYRTPESNLLEKMFSGKDPPTWALRFCKAHSFSEVRAYHSKWHRLLGPLSPREQSLVEKTLERIENLDPHSMLYADYRDPAGATSGTGSVYTGRSGSFEKDVWQLHCMCDALPDKANHPVRFQPVDVGLPPDTSGLWDLLFGDAFAPAAGFSSDCAPTLSESALTFVLSYLSDDFKQRYLFPLHEDENWPPFDPINVRRKGRHGRRSFEAVPAVQMNFATDGRYVGEIQHIPKNGTVGRRDIAVPNRFIQRALWPMIAVLGVYRDRLPCDCTRDQGKFDLKITSRMANHLYCGSVDLSKATDNLPFQWGLDILDRLTLKLTNEQQSSLDLFQEVAKGRWYNGGYLDRWLVGQPLGTLPSFPVLAITHNLFCEALSFVLGFRHSPYAILGDDLVVFNRRLRTAYIRQMQNYGVPLSLHKSYEGNLVEFAGKIFLPRMAPFYSPDHGQALTWNNLLDYQWASGIAIPWNLVSNSSLGPRFTRSVRDAIRRYKASSTLTSDPHQVDHSGVDPDFSGQVPLASGASTRVEEKQSLFSMLDLETVYNLAASARCGYVSRGSSTPYFREEDIPLVVRAMLLAEERTSHRKTEQPFEMPVTGIRNVGGHPVTLGPYSGSGFAPGYRKVQKQEWFKEKYSPASTDDWVFAAVSVLASTDLQRRNRL